MMEKCSLCGGLPGTRVRIIDVKDIDIMLENKKFQTKLDAIQDYIDKQKESIGMAFSPKLIIDGIEKILNNGETK